MGKRSAKFQSVAEKTAFDKKHRATIRFNISKYDAAVEKGMAQFTELELLKEKAASIKRNALIKLEEKLLQFEANFTKNGGVVIWAETGEQAAKEVLSICQEEKAKLVVKSKSMTTEEIKLNEVLEAEGIEALETDLGEYIVQVAGEKPYHIVTPAMHKSKEDVAKLFHEKFDTPVGSSPEFLTNFVRGKLRQKYQDAQIGVTGANFILPDIGGIALTENEGNALMSGCFPNIHIVVVGIEKMISGVDDLHYFWPLLAGHGTGQKVTAYNSIFTGPKKNNERDGPSKMIVILLDNGRSKLLGVKGQKEALQCIRCGACLNACPIYKNIGGYTFDTTYSGPIGSVITPHFRGMEEFGHLSFASTLCGKCAEVCPVKIDLPRLLLLNRRDSVKNGMGSATEKRAMKFWMKTMLKRKRMDRSARLKNFGMRHFGQKPWGPRRAVIVFPDSSFRVAWMKRRKSDFTS